MKSIKPTPMPHFGVLDDGLLPLVVKQIFSHASSAKELNSLLNIIKDRSYFLADKNEQGQDRILSLMDAVNLTHSSIAEVTFKNIGEADQDSLMHFGFEQFAYMSILDCCVLTALCLIDQTDVLLYRDYSQYKEGYVQHFISTAPSDNKEHLLVLHVSKTVCSYLVNHEGRVQIAQPEKFAQKLFDLMLALRKDGFLAPVFLKQTDSSYANLLVKLCLKRNEGAASSQLNFLKAQLKVLLKAENYEFAAQIRFKIKNIESNLINQLSMKNIFEILTLEDKNTCYQMLENVKSSEQFTKIPTLEIEAEKLIDLAWHLTSGSVKLKKINVDGNVVDGVVLAENVSINDIDYEKMDGSNSITIFDTIQSYKLTDIATFLEKYKDL